MGNEQEVFRFDLNESLYFEQGQEVGEMTGISLDPDISIQAFNDYVSIRGVIELSGSYQKEVTAWEKEETALGSDDYHSKRYVEKVVGLDDDQAEFIHRFPVEISVPANRVSDLDDVTVAIESFDYEVPNQNQLKLSSTIEIHGIHDETVDTSESEQENEPVSPPRNDETFDFDIKMKKEEQLETDEPFYEEHPPALPSEEEQHNQVNEDDAEEDQSPSRIPWKSKKSQTLSEFFGNNVEELSQQGESVEEESYTENAEDPPDFSVYHDEGLAESEESEEAPEDVRYLADMFRNDEEEKYTKMRLCIVQYNDTLEGIAERYEVSALQLLKQNRMTEEGIEEGQLLYIPYKKHS
ncbi:stage VI sporulation protein D [Lentibacillus kapialis]|uniref:Stage VI sporulation protein D n=1 Tax=Lentibacillus kapialis TaxID=340214 RepID=A0A917PLQ8_9BACI|nr:stage VI sporulation protein D [Lentibacillus kapialis]GGJ84190.1 stage VI sporulation protein D [Lentibacillus kapialis]